MTVCTGHNKAISELAEAFGLKNCTQFTLTVKAGELVTLTSVHAVDPTNICSLTQTIKKYKLKEEK